MSYLPELRRSLVSAAEREARGSTSVAKASDRRHWFNGLALLATTATTLIVAALVVVLAGHRDVRSPAATSPSYGSRSAELEAAAQMLNSFRVPAGAVAVAKDPSRPRSLGWVESGLPVPSAVDLSRFYVVRGDPQSVIDELVPERSVPAQLLPPDRGPLADTFSTSSSSSGAGSSGGMSSASENFSLLGVGGMARQFVVQTARAGRGMTAIRVDAQTWWTVRRPPGEQFPAATRAIIVQPLGRLPKSSVPLHPPARLTAPGDVSSTVALLNAFDVIQPDSVPCRSTSDFRLRLTFVGTGEHPAPVATIDDNCNRVDVWLHGRQQPSLTFSSETHAIDALHVLEMLERLMGAPLTTTWAQLLAEAKRDRPTTPQASTSAGAVQSSRATATPAKRG